MFTGYFERFRNHFILCEHGSGRGRNFGVDDGEIAAQGFDTGVRSPNADTPHIGDILYHGHDVQGFRAMVSRAVVSARPSMRFMH